MTTVLVTGATDGIGQATALQLAQRGADVIVHGRDQQRVDRVVAAIGTAAVGVVADFSSLLAVRGMAESLADPGIDVLINNAATFEGTLTRTRDGHEMTWQVNHLAGALLTDLLLDPLAERRGRVIFMSAAMYARARLDLSDPDFSSRRFNGQEAYGQSKLANVLYMAELARRLGPARDVTVNALHPGVVGTKLLDAAFGTVPEQTVVEGAESLVRLALDPDAADTTGAFFIRNRPRAITGPAADAAFSRALYELTCRQLGLPGLPAV